MQKKTRETISQVFIITTSIILLLLSFIPIILMIVLSLKSNAQIYGDFWSIPNPIEWANYGTARDVLARNMVNSIVYVTIAVMGTILLSSLSGYVFARLEFPGRKVLFMMILSLMMVPGVLTLTPSYKLIQALHLKDSMWALLLPWMSGGQIFGIILCRTFIAEQPSSIFEAARVDGASEIKTLFNIAIPLSKPILATIIIMNMIGNYNDYIWPLMVIDSNSKQVITVAVRVFQSINGSIDIGSLVAGYVITTIPLLILFSIGSRFYIEGITSGAVKA